MTVRKTLIAIIALVILGSGCSQSSSGQATTVDTEPTIEPTIQSSGSEASTTPVTATTSPGKTDDTVSDPAQSDESLDGQISLDIISGNEVSNEIYSAKITGMRFTPVSSAKEAIADSGLDPEAVFEPDVQTVIGISLEGENRSEDLLTWFPGQSSIVIGFEQLDTDLLLSDYLAPSSDWRPGVKSDGVSVYKSTQSIDELVSLGALTFIMKPAMDSNFGIVVPEQDLNIAFTKP